MAVDTLARNPPRPTGIAAKKPEDWRDSPPALSRTLELVFFAHMEMADASDQLLAQHGLGRPHHRVLYFAHLSPGIAVGELMSLLRISNQALSRTMQQLAAQGFIEQRYCVDDRRVRRHHVTDKGRTLLAASRKRQFEVIRKAHSGCSQDDIEAFWRTLTLLSRPEDLAWISSHPAAADLPPGT